ncbi:TonB family protein [Opitutales bacterium]|nr:TonB family protein [Opitutales bacterium]MDB2681975.1 TonB family protein [Opitutales bacterium]
MKSHTYCTPTSQRDMPIAMVLGFVVSIVIFIVMALAQILGDVQKPAQSYDEQLVAYTPPIIEDIEEDIQEDEPEPEPMDTIEKEPPKLSLDQLDVALNPGTGGNLASSDLSVPDFSVGAQALSMNFINFRDLDNKPRPTRQIAPIHPPALKNQGIEGRVYIRFDIDKQGNVVDATVKKSDHPTFDAYAVDAVRQWKFEPGMQNGELVPFTMIVPITFSLSN